MKIRQGFVSNSSTSSFVCNICGHADAGMDASPEELEFTQFSCGHTVCMSHLSRDILDRKGRNAECPESCDDCDRAECPDDSDGLDKCYCPLCTLKVVRKEDLFRYVVMKQGIDVKELIKEVTTNFGDLDKLLFALKKSEENKSEQEPD